MQFQDGSLKSSSQDITFDLDGGKKKKEKEKEKTHHAEDTRSTHLCVLPEASFEAMSDPPPRQPSSTETVKERAKTKSCLREVSLSCYHIEQVLFLIS